MREYWLYPWRILPVVFRLVFQTYEAILLAKGVKGFAVIILCLAVFWHIYTPIHELFHVFGCWLTGGEVTELALKPQYGAHFLQKMFPFIVPESDYAGQLTGFTTPNDFAYAVVDFFPYLLSLPGVAFFILSRKKNITWLFGLATIVGLIPAFAIPGDFFEAASLLTTRIASALDAGLPARALVSDDVFKLISTLHQQGQLGVLSGTMVGLTILLAGYACLLCWVCQWQCAIWWLGEANLAQYSEKSDPEPPATQVGRTILES